MAAVKLLKEQQHKDAKIDKEILIMLIWSLAALQMPNQRLAKAVVE